MTIWLDFDVWSGESREKIKIIVIVATFKATARKSV